MFDDGPRDMLLRLRTRLGVYDYGPWAGSDGRLLPQSTIGRFLSCPYCVSGAVAPFVALLALFPSLIGDIFLAWLGVAGGAMLLIRWRPWR